MFQLDPLYALYAGLAIIAAIAFSFWAVKSDERALQYKRVKVKKKPKQSDNRR